MNYRLTYSMVFHYVSACFCFSNFLNVALAVALQREKQKNWLWFSNYKTQLLHPSFLVLLMPCCQYFKYVIYNIITITLTLTTTTFYMINFPNQWHHQQNCICLLNQIVLKNFFQIKQMSKTNTISYNFPTISIINYKNCFHNRKNYFHNKL